MALNHSPWASNTSLTAQGLGKMQISQLLSRYTELQTEGEANSLWWNKSCQVMLMLRLENHWTGRGPAPNAASMMRQATEHSVRKILVLVACCLQLQNDSANDDGGRNCHFPGGREHHSPCRSFDLSLGSSHLSHVVIGAISNNWWKMKPEAAIGRNWESSAGTGRAESLKQMSL